MQAYLVIQGHEIEPDYGHEIEPDYVTSVALKISIVFLAREHVPTRVFFL